ncbi:MAG: hypothetical protein E4H28_01765 [Gemmatimonadales bacterium]|nr:MAG: hypothetical protein E4H28_01765 [Gemmatimonadales bacterium]
MSGSRGASPWLIVVAVLVIVGFLYWLNIQSEVFKKDVQAVTAEEATGELVEFIPAQLASEPGSVVGQTGVLRDLGVVTRLGRGAVSVDLDGTTSYPILLDSDIIRRGTTVIPGDRITAYGRAYTLNDSIRAEWVNQSAVDAENSAMIPKTTSFVLADSLTFN